MEIVSIDAQSVTNNAATLPLANVSTNTNATSAVTEVVNNESDEDVIRNQKLVEEFQYLLEKSQSLFSGLR